jgi:hypothetical protein
MNEIIIKQGKKRLRFILERTMDYLSTLPGDDENTHLLTLLELLLRQI